MQHDGSVRDGREAAQGGGTQTAAGLGTGRTVSPARGEQTIRIKGQSSTARRILGVNPPGSWARSHAVARRGGEAD